MGKVTWGKKKTKTPKLLGRKLVWKHLIVSICGMDMGWWGGETQEVGTESKRDMGREEREMVGSRNGEEGDKHSRERKMGVGRRGRKKKPKHLFVIKLSKAIKILLSLILLFTYIKGSPPVIISLPYTHTCACPQDSDLCRAMKPRAELALHLRQGDYSSDRCSRSEKNTSSLTKQFRVRTREN